MGFGRLLDEATRARMAEGVAMHRLFQQELAERGVLVRAEVPIRDAELGVSGRVDALIQDGDSAIPVEYKTVRTERFEQMVQAGPAIAHWAQLALYLACLPMNPTTGILVVDERAPARRRLTARQASDTPFGAWVQERVRRARQLAEERRLPPREPARHCLDCDRWQRCYPSEEARQRAVDEHPDWTPEPPLAWGEFQWQLHEKALEG